MRAETLQSCPTLCDPMNYSPPQAPLSMGFSRQEYWGGLPFPSPEDLPDPGIEPGSPALTGGFFTTAPPTPQKKHNLNLPGLWTLVSFRQYFCSLKHFSSYVILNLGHVCKSLNFKTWP